MPARRLPAFIRPTLGIGGIIAAFLAIAWFGYQSNHAALESSVLVENQPYRIAVELDDSQITVGDTVRLNFTVTYEDTVSDIYAQDRVVHYVIASENYQDFFHTFSPEVVGPGRFALDHTFTQTGRYRIWTEVVDTKQGRALHHGETADLISFVDLNVTGTAAPAPDQLVYTQEVPVGEYTVKLTMDSPRAGRAEKIQLHVENAAGIRQEVFAEEPAIYVMVGPNFDFFRHTHTQPALQETTVELTEIFPTVGEYLFFVEVYVKQAETYSALQVPFGITVK